jgi:NtrC-family two-component system response regulator AlgB
MDRGRDPSTCSATRTDRERIATTRARKSTTSRAARVGIDRANEEPRVTNPARPLELDVLVIDDDKRTRATLRVCLHALGCRVEEAANGPAVRGALERRSYDLVLLDLRLGDESGLDLLPLVRARSQAAEIVIVTGHATISSAMQATRLGAHDFLAKPFSPAQIQELAERAAARRRVEAQLGELRAAVGAAVPELDLRTESPRMRQLLDVVERVAAQPAPVLLCGEPGTGRTVLARRLHALSTRAAGPWIVMRCAGAPEEQLARALCGQAEGAFLDDPLERAGRLDAAERGTLYLDEVAELPPRLQARLARVMADGRFERAGGSEVRRADVRVVAATARELEKEVRAGRFRRDLWERLSPLSVTVPPLRERREDILPLARRFLAFYSRGGPIKSPDLTLEAETALVAYGWPGNVRELREAMERAAVLRVGTRVGVEALPERVTAPGARVPYLGGEFSLDAIEREHILRVLASAPTQEEASRILGIDISTLWRKRKRYGGGAAGSRR